jgi:hypothetical protein
LLALSLSTVTAAAVAAPLALKAVSAEANDPVRIGPAVSAEEVEPNTPTIADIVIDGSRATTRGNIGLAPQTDEAPGDSASDDDESSTTEVAEDTTTSETEPPTTTTPEVPESSETSATVGSIGPSTTEVNAEDTTTTETPTDTTEDTTTTTVEDSSTSIDQATTSVIEAGDSSDTEPQANG